MQLPFQSNRDVQGCGPLWYVVRYPCEHKKKVHQTFEWVHL